MYSINFNAFKCWYQLSFQKPFPSISFSFAGQALIKYIDESFYVKEIREHLIQKEERRRKKLTVVDFLLFTLIHKDHFNLNKYDLI